MDVLKFIEAGEKLGMKGVELQAWAEQQTRYAREERAQEQEFESRRIESECPNRELECEVLARKLRLEALQTRIPILGRADENEVPAETPNRKLTSPHKLIPVINDVKLLVADRELHEEMPAKFVGNADNRCEVSLCEVQCDSHVEHTQAVIDYPKPHHMGNAKDFSCPETFIHEPNILNSTFPLEKERTEQQLQDLGNSQDFLCPKILNNEKGSSQSCFPFDEAITSISLTKEYDACMEAKKVHCLIEPVDEINEDLKVFDNSPATATEERCSEFVKFPGSSACCLKRQAKKRVSERSLTTNIKSSQLVSAQSYMRSWRENKCFSCCKERLRSKQQCKERRKQNRSRKRPQPSRFAQCKWDAHGRWQGATHRSYMNTPASQGQPLWCDSAHRKYVRYKKSVFIMGKSTGCTKDLKTKNGGLLF